MSNTSVSHSVGHCSASFTSKKTSKVEDREPSPRESWVLTCCTNHQQAIDTRSGKHIGMCVRILLRLFQPLRIFVVEINVKCTYSRSQADFRMFGLAHYLAAAKTLLTVSPNIKAQCGIRAYTWHIYFDCSLCANLTHDWKYQLLYLLFTVVSQVVECKMQVYSACWRATVQGAVQLHCFWKIST